MQNERPQPTESVQIGGNIVAFQPTAYLKLDPWGALWQWHEASAETFHGAIQTIGKWIIVQKGQG